MNLILKFNWFKEAENYEWLKNEVFYEEFSAFPFKYYNSYLKRTEVLLLFYFLMFIFVLLLVFSLFISFTFVYFFRWIASLLAKI